MYRRLLFAVPAILLVIGNSLHAASEWTIASGGNGHFYEAVEVSGGITWTDAAAAANAAGGYLATILSSAENEFVFSLVDAPQFWNLGSNPVNLAGPWLGGFQPAGSVEPDGGWEWLNNDGGFGVEDVSAYTNWHPPINGSVQEPNNSNQGEEALQFFSWNSFDTPQRSSFWNDAGREFSPSGVVGYVVETVPEPSSWTLLCLMLTGVCWWRPRRLA